MYLSDGPAVPVVLGVSHRAERTSLHAIDVERSVQVIDLVLQDARVPAVGVDCDRFGAFVQAFHADTQAAADDCRKPFDAKTPFKEVDCFIADQRQRRVDNDVEIDG